MRPGLRQREREARLVTRLLGARLLAATLAWLLGLLGLLGAGRALAERQLDILLLAVPQDRNGQGVTSLLACLQVGDEVLGALHRLAVERRDDVTTSGDLARASLLL